MMKTKKWKEWRERLWSVCVSFMSLCKPIWLKKAREKEWKKDTSLSHSVHYSNWFEPIWAKAKLFLVLIPPCFIILAHSQEDSIRILSLLTILSSSEPSLFRHLSSFPVESVSNMWCLNMKSKWKNFSLSPSQITHPHRWTGLSFVDSLVYSILIGFPFFFLSSFASL